MGEVKQVGFGSGQLFKAPYLENQRGDQDGEMRVRPLLEEATSHTVQAASRRAGKDSRAFSPRATTRNTALPTS